MEIKVYKKGEYWYVVFNDHMIGFDKDLMKAVNTLDKCKKLLNIEFDEYNKKEK